MFRNSSHEETVGRISIKACSAMKMKTDTTVCVPKVTSWKAILFSFLFTNWDEARFEILTSYLCLLRKRKKKENEFKQWQWLNRDEPPVSVSRGSFIISSKCLINPSLAKRSQCKSAIARVNINMTKFEVCLYAAEGNRCRSKNRGCYMIPRRLKGCDVILCLHVFDTFHRVVFFPPLGTSLVTFCPFHSLTFPPRAEGPRRVSPLECFWGCRKLRKWALLCVVLFKFWESLVPPCLPGKSSEPRNGPPHDLP